MRIPRVIDLDYYERLACEDDLWVMEQNGELLIRGPGEKLRIRSGGARECMVLAARLIRYAEKLEE